MAKASKNALFVLTSHDELANTLQLSQVNLNDYDAVFYSGAHLLLLQSLQPVKNPNN